MNEHPIHPGLQQQGLGAPSAPQQGQGNSNPYVRPNEALAQANQQLTGEAQMKSAQAYEAGAKAEQERTKAAIIQAANQRFSQPTMREQLLGNGHGLEGPVISPEIEAHSDQVAMKLLEGQIDPVAVKQRADQGDLVAAQAIQKAQAMQAHTEQQYNQQQAAQNGLGQIQ